MRLINAGTGELEEFLGHNVPKYAILSHTWAEEEVLFQDFTDPEASSKKGFQKIQMTCRLAGEAGLKYVWVDTCCIDKTSSAELSEAINSMYKWYERAEVCFVYLSDLEPGHLDTSLSKCRWFTRGWTLQELIAPTNILFFDREWNAQTSKKQLVEKLSEITSVGIDILRHNQDLSTVPVAEKMAWAAHRQTTRVEDTAYCLMGIFDLNMPLLYGEENKAFQRLQEEIIRSTADLSIFAWKLPPSTNRGAEGKDRMYSGVLADSPRSFSRQTPLIKITKYGRREFSITNIGIKSYVHVLSRKIAGRTAYNYILPLDCADGLGKCFGVLLRKCGVDKFVRDDPWTILEDVSRFTGNAAKSRYLLTRLPEFQSRGPAFSIAQARTHVLQIQESPDIEVHDAWSWGRYDDEDQLFFVGDDPEWDSVILRLVVYPVRKILGPHHGHIKLECNFYATGWSKLSPDGIQCSLVDYRKNYTSLNEAQTKISTWDYTTTQVLETLTHYEIPKSSSVIFPIPDSQSSITISFKATQVTDPALCQNAFWSIEFVTALSDANNLPEIPHDNWRLDP